MKKKKPPVRTYDVKLEGDLEGFELVMTGMSTRDLIAVNSGETETAAALELVLAHVIDHNFDVEDLHDLDGWITLEVLGAWSEAVKASALPPDSATS